ncbi:MAG: TlpA family protein disulfide reductase [Pseudomonas sp.]|uniref:TlpA disulfide reductase family protein n=1 Tax=Pseudomonas sp. YY-1 TaxID=2058659 RepID=UPI000CB9F485|nr:MULTISPECIES: TlpA disulfide reductase family protein [unclassified Pseudomonas]MPT19211.1 TlpA family protein disulfide reductase [Pseudomonas sp.]PKQ41756.1 peroxiredoxin [Pseudomonas sp. YY-1]
MLTLNIGPLALGVSHVLLLGSLLLATLVGWLIGRRHGCNPESQLFRMLMLGLLVARLTFVLMYAGYYRDEPWRVVDIRDGGFIAWPGVLAGLMLGAWYLWHRAQLRRSLGVAMSVGLALWLGGSLVLQALEQGTRLPDLQVRDMQGNPVNLRDYAGQPLVVNLWATWCPPCRREMPVLMQAQQREAAITFLFVNQGESAGLVSEFIAAQQLSLGHLLLDEQVKLGLLVGSRALPTTLFYDAEGRQIGSHLGELSHASLERALARLRGD